MLGMGRCKAVRGPRQSRPKGSQGGPEGMCLLRCIQGPFSQGPQLFFFRLNPPCHSTASNSVPIADPPACSTSGLTSRVFRQCLLPAHHNARSAPLTSLATFTKHLQNAPTDNAGPPCALASSVRSLWPINTAEGTYIMRRYVCTVHTPTLSTVQHTRCSETTSSLRTRAPLTTP